MNYFRTLFSIALAASCLTARDNTHPLAERTPPPGETLFTTLSPEETGVDVPNVFNDPRMWGDRFREYTLGALETGVAVADFDGDGNLDIYAISKNGANALYRQIAPWKFEDVAATSGVDVADDPSGQTGVTVIDIDQDGSFDLYVCRVDAPNLLFVNQGDGTFTEQAAAYGLDIHDASVHATFADYDGDGDLDAYVTTNILDFSKSPQGQPDYLMRNNGDGTFENVALDAGIWGKSQGHTAIWFDANRDGWPDLYVANDFETPDRFYMNNGDGSFTDVVDERLPHVTYFSMGADSGDLNNDGEIDFLVADMRDQTRQEFMRGMEEMGRGLWEMERVADLIPQYMWNAVYLGTGTDHFEEVAHITGMKATGWTWAARIADLNNDGWNDVFYTNGMLRNFIDADLVDKQNIAPNPIARARVWRDAPLREEPNLVFRNDGNLNFTDVSTEWGLDHDGVSFGSSLADLDGDGDLDIVFANLEGPPTLLRNDSTTGNRVVIELKGLAPNRSAIGAEVILTTDRGQYVRQVFGERGIVSSERAPMIFGLAEGEKIFAFDVIWPDGHHTMPGSPTINHRWVVEQEGSLIDFKSSEQPPHEERFTGAFANTAKKRGIDYESDAYPLEELARQRLLPRRLGQTAPALATADVNGDGSADIFVSGARGQAGRLFLGNAEGNFSAAAAQPWEKAEAADDTGAVFLDANLDGNPDLYISAGGVEPEEGDSLLHDRLYLGDGSGGFASADSIDDGISTTAVATTTHGGVTHLFVGGRSVPGSWPLAPRSFLYRASPDGMVDVTEDIAPALMEAGMVTDATWADLDGDNDPDLVVSTEWGPIKAFRNDSGTFTEITADVGLADLTGWWSAVATADVNGDGHLDIIAGNVGLNTKYQASPEQPATVFAGDLDGSGRFEILEAQYDGDALYPLRGLSKLSYSFRRLRRQYRTFERYADATVYDLFSAEYLNAALRLEATELRSGVFLQQSDGTFAFEALPVAAQLAPIHGIAHQDIDGDGQADLLLVGNDFSPEPSTGRFDGSLGRLLLGDGSGNFEAVLPGTSGIVVPGDTRALAVLPPLPGHNRPRIVTADAMGPVKLFEPTPSPDS